MQTFAGAIKSFALEDPKLVDPTLTFAAGNKIFGSLMQTFAGAIKSFALEDPKLVDPTLTFAAAYRSFANS